MRALNGEEMLMAWENSRQRPEQQAALALLVLASPERSLAELAALPLAERNALLLELRASTLGPQMESCARCPACGMQLEFALDARVLAQGLREQTAENPDALDGFAMRPVTTQDLLDCAAAASDEEARLLLLRRTTWGRGADRDEAALIDAGLIDRFARLNAAAEIQVQLQCADCESRPQIDLDIAHYLVREIASAGRRLLLEIHQLASAYGWSEQSIAGMSGARRAAYLEMLNA